MGCIAAIYMKIKACEDIDSNVNIQGLLMCAKKHGSVIFMVRLFPGMLEEMLMQYMQDNGQPWTYDLGPLLLALATHYWLWFSHPGF